MLQRTQLVLVALSTLAVTSGGVVTAIALDQPDRAAPEAAALAFTAPGAASATPSTPPTPSATPSTPPTPSATLSASSPQPSQSPTRTVATPSAARPPVVPAPVAPPVGTTAAPVPAQSESISYTVERGDTLSDIAAWFALNGYRGLYEANWAVIGSDPDLIRPGQSFTITGGTLQMSPG